MEVDEEEIRNKKYFPFKIGTWLFLLIFIRILVSVFNGIGIFIFNNLYR